MCWCRPEIRTPDCGGPDCVPPPPMTYWQAYTNSDLTEGRGHDVHIAYFVRREDAVRCVVGKGPMGTNAYVREVRRHAVFKSYAEYETRQVGEARKRALEKLSAEERRLLGLE